MADEVELLVKLGLNLENKRGANVHEPQTFHSSCQVVVKFGSRPGLASAELWPSR